MATWAVALGLLVEPAAAQERDAPADAPVSFGPLHITPSLQLVQFGVDSNVFNVRGDQQPDLVLIGGPQVDFAVQVKRFAVTAETSTNLVYYHSFVNQRGINFDATVTGEFQLPRLRLFVADSFLDTRQRPNLEIDVRVRRQENATRAGAELDISRTLSIEMTGSRSSRKYDGDDQRGAILATRLDRDALAATGTLRYALTPLTALRLMGQAREENFISAPARSNKSWSVVPSVQFNPRALVSGNAEVGFRKIIGRDDALPDFSGPVASVDLLYKFWGSSSIRVTASRDVQFSFEAFEPYYVAGELGAIYRHQFSSLYGVRLGGQRFTYRYRQFVSGVPSDVSSGRVDTTRGILVTLYRRLTRETEIGFDMAHFSRRSNRTRVRDYDSFQAGINMGYAF